MRCLMISEGMGAGSRKGNGNQKERILRWPGPGQVSEEAQLAWKEIEKGDT